MVRQVPTPLLLPPLDANTKRGAHRVERDLLDKKQSLVGRVRPVCHEFDLLEEAAIISKFAPISAVLEAAVGGLWPSQKAPNCWNELPLHRRRRSYVSGGTMTDRYRLTLVTPMHYDR